MHKISDSTRQEAVVLRQQGLTYAEISKQLGISLGWCKANLAGVDTNGLEFTRSLPPVGAYCVYYLLFGSVPLYIGSSFNIVKRLYNHKMSSEFFSKSTGVLVEVYNTESEMLFNEVQSIARYKPVYNTRSTTGGVSSAVIDPVQSIAIAIPQTIKIKEIELQHDKTN